MATTIGNEYEHIDFTHNNITTRHPIKDATARSMVGDIVKISDSDPQLANNKIWIKETPESEVQVPTYAEFQELDGDVNDLKSAISYITDNSAIPVTESGKYINLSGSTADITNPTVSQSGFSYSVVPCAEGDTFTINAVGGADARAYGFIDSSGNILGVANASATLSNFVIVAPADSAYLIINDKSSAVSYEGKILAKRVDLAENEINALVDIPGDSKISLSDINIANYYVTYAVDDTTNTITITNSGNGLYAGVHTSYTFIQENLEIGKTYRLHAKGRAISGNPNMVVAIRDLDGLVLKRIRLNETDEGFVDFIVDQNMVSLQLFVSYGESTQNSVSEFSEIWIKEYNTTGIDDKARSNIEELSREIASLENLDEYIEIPCGIEILERSLNYESGDLNSGTSQNYGVTEYVDVSRYNTIQYRRTKSTSSYSYIGMAFYNENKEYVSGIKCVTGQSSMGYESTLYKTGIPNNAVYARFSAYMDTQTYGDFKVFGENKLYTEIDGIKKAIADQDISNGCIYTDLSETIEGLGWEYGRIDTSGAIVADSEVRLKRLTFDAFISNAAEISIADGIEVFLYAYDSNTKNYLGRYTTEDVFAPTSGIAKRFTERINLTEFNNKIFRLVLKNSDDSDFESTSIGPLSIDLYGKVYIKPVVEALQNKKEYSYIGSPEIYIPSNIEDTVIDSMTPSEVYAIYDNLVTNYPKWITRENNIGIDSDNNYIRHYIIRMGNPCYNSEDYPNVTTNYWRSAYDNKHIIINAGTHGDEKTSVLGVAKFAELLLSSTDKWAMFIKANFVIHIVPILNVWGFNNMSRNNKDDVNINRDFADFETSEAVALRDLIASLGTNLKIVIDSHNTQSDIGMMGTKQRYDKHLFYIRTATSLAGIMSPYLSQHYAANKFPYFYAWESTSSNNLMEYVNQHGYIGGTIETPRNYNAGANNHAETSSMVIGLLANLIQTYGTEDLL